MKKLVSIALTAMTILTLTPIQNIQAKESPSSESAIVVDYDISVENATVVRCIKDYQGVSGLCVSGFLFNRGTKTVQISPNQVTLVLNGKKIKDAYYQELEQQVSENLNQNYYENYTKNKGTESKILKNGESSFFNFLTISPSAKKIVTIKIQANTALKDENGTSVTDQKTKNNYATEKLLKGASPDLAIQGLSANPVIEGDKITSYNLSGYALNLSQDPIAIKEFLVDVRINKTKFKTLDSEKGDLTFFNDAWFNNLSKMTINNSDCSALKTTYDTCVSGQTVICNQIQNANKKQTCIEKISIACEKEKTAYNSCLENASKNETENKSISELKKEFATVLLPGSKAFFQTTIPADQFKQSAKNIISVKGSTTFTVAKLPEFPDTSKMSLTEQANATTKYIKDLLNISWQKNSADKSPKNNTSIFLPANFTQIKAIKVPSQEEINKGKENLKNKKNDAKEKANNKLNGKKNKENDDKNEEEQLTISVSGNIYDADTKKPVTYAYAVCSVNSTDGGLNVSADDKGYYSMEITKGKSEFQSLVCYSYKASSDYEKSTNPAVDLKGIKGGEKYIQDFNIKLGVKTEEPVYMTFVGFLNDKATGKGIEGENITCAAYDASNNKINSGSIKTGKDGYIDGQKLISIPKNIYLSKYICSPDPIPTGYKANQVEGALNQNMTKNTSYTITITLEK